MSRQPTNPSLQPANVTWGLRIMMLMTSLVWVLVLLSVIARVGPGPKLFNSNLFWGIFAVIFIGPMLVSKRGRAHMSRMHHDPITNGFRLLVDLPVTIWFCVLYQGYWWLGLIFVADLALQLSSPCLERAAARGPRPPES